MLIFMTQSTLYRYKRRYTRDEEENERERNGKRFSGNIKLRVYITVYVNLRDSFIVGFNGKEIDTTT